MPRFFLNGGSTIQGGTAFILGEDAEHVRVLRLRVGDRLVICDGKGKDFHCSIKNLAPKEVEAEVFEVVPCKGEPSVKALILCGLPKGDKAEYIIQKCTEAGASEIWFFQSHRCVAKLHGDADKKVSRWQRIAEEAAKQSGRGIIPTIGYLPDIAEAFNKAKETDLPLFLYETGERKSLKETIESAQELRSAAILTGPEGGFEPFEAELAAMMGLPLCSMGPRIFRCETAPVAALSALMYATGNMD
ncbi:MAG: 16S rRNA (uracil(1498)-N(3))-methyltransferase [Oscillospiraceae bacterium]|nr:16S rRNA (uracil(1498)-N(3))-methyltransferase [Oscillospiraceae bacterium]